jgi:hypothetical protein
MSVNPPCPVHDLVVIGTRQGRRFMCRVCKRRTYLDDSMAEKVAPPAEDVVGSLCGCCHHPRTTGCGGFFCGCRIRGMESRTLSLSVALGVHHDFSLRFHDKEKESA